METEQVLESLKKLHPQSTVPLTIPDDAPASIVKYSTEEVLRVIKSFRRDTAPGPSSLRIAHIREALICGESVAS